MHSLGLQALMNTLFFYAIIMQANHADSLASGYHNSLSPGQAASFSMTIYEESLTSTPDVNWMITVLLVCPYCCTLYDSVIVQRSVALSKILHLLTVC